eukprot:355570-Chlamydomonas_euryale.AAC.2
MRRVGGSAKCGRAWVVVAAGPCTAGCFRRVWLRQCAAPVVMGACFCGTVQHRQFLERVAAALCR